MVNVFILFDDILKIGQISNKINQNFSGLNIQKLIDISQLNKADFASRNIFITNSMNAHAIKSLNIEETHLNLILNLDKFTRTDNIALINSEDEDIAFIKEINNYLIKYYQTKEYAPLPIHLFVEERPYISNLYIKLSQTRYVKIINANSTFSEGTLQNLILKDINILWCKGSDFSNFYSNHAPSKKSIDKISRIESSELSGIEALHKHILDLGFNHKLIELTKKLHKNIKDKYNNKFMKKLLNRFDNLEGDYLYNHSYLTSVIALEVGRNFPWMNLENKEKIYLGSILHDLGHVKKENVLRENFSLEEIQNMAKDEREDILNHPIKFAKHLAQIESIHPDVISIVKEHHGVHAENSYPRSISPSEVNLVFALFILSHEFAMQLYKIDFDLSKIPSELIKLSEKFNIGSYKKILPEFRVSMEDVLITEKVA